MLNFSARKNPDFLHPIKESGRAEIIIATYDQIIRCDNEAILKHIIFDKYDFYITEYPILKKLKNITENELFTISSSFLDTELLPFIRGNTNFLWKDSEILSKIRSEYNPNMSNRLRTNIALEYLLTEGYIQKLYIVDNNMNNMKLAILFDHFKDLCNKKVFAVEGNIINFIERNNISPTTIMSNSIDDIFELSKMKHKNQMYYICSAKKLSNYE